MAMKAMKAAKPQNKDDQKANPMKAMKKPLKAKKQPTKTTKLKEADGAMVAEVMRALRWVQENHRAPMGIAAEQAEGGDSRRGSEGRGHRGECGEARRRGWAANQEGQGREGSG